MHRAARHTILLVEADPALQRVIALGLQYRGLRVVEAASPDDFSGADRCSPDLVLLDIDGAVGNGAQVLTEIQSRPLLASLPIVLLAWGESIPASAVGDNTLVRYASLAKPFDARALYSVIESLLSSENASQAIQQEHIRPAYDAVAVYSPSPSPAMPAAPAASAAPMITAAGLLLAFAGLMLQIAITAVGLLIVIAALLWWTLGTKPENLSVAR